MINIDEVDNLYYQGMISEINSQIIQLMSRKKSILDKVTQQEKEATQSDADAVEDVDSIHKKAEEIFKGGSYARYLYTMAKYREPVEDPLVVFQGESGAYSQEACRRFFGKNVRTKGLYAFEDTFKALANGEADYAVLPIENSSTGAIRQVYDQLEQYSFFFVGENTVQINHALMALPGTKLEDITTVYSHEQGLFQCEKFLAEHPDWRTVAQADTAGSAKMVAEKKDPHKAAICSELAAEIYGLEILKYQVNTQGKNRTRFVVISPKPELRPNRDKVCISFTTANDSGALHNVLTIFAVHEINLVRLESRPIPERNWEYMFFLEFTGDLLTPQIRTVIHEIALMTKDLRVLGNFTANL